MRKLVQVWRRNSGGLVIPAIGARWLGSGASPSPRSLRVIQPRLGPPSKRLDRRFALETWLCRRDRSCS
jgi:hypothetical protein